MRGRYGDRSEAERRPPTGIASSKMEPSEPDLTSLNSPPWFLTKVEAASNRQQIIVDLSNRVDAACAHHVLAKTEPRHPLI